MFRMSKLADYGMVIMTFLADQPKVTHNARAITAHTQLTLPVVSKILKLLAKAGLLLSERGIQGGYQLAMPANEISVVRIMAALDDKLSLTECCEHAEGGSACSLEKNCNTKKHWHVINQTINSMLQKISLADFYEQSPNR